MTKDEQLADLSTRFFAGPLGKAFDFDADQLSTEAFVAKWVPLLNKYGQPHLAVHGELALWVCLVFAEVEIHLQDYQH